jgi:hypothetical protein
VSRVGDRHERHTASYSNPARLGRDRSRSHGELVRARAVRICQTAERTAFWPTATVETAPNSSAAVVWQESGPWPQRPRQSSAEVRGLTQRVGWPVRAAIRS